MTATPEPRDFQTEVLERLERLDSDIKRVEQKLDVDIQRLDEQAGEIKERTDKWEERFLQLSKDNLAISRTVIIAAASVVVFGSLLDKAEVLVEGFSRLFGR